MTFSKLPYQTQPQNLMGKKFILKLHSSGFDPNAQYLKQMTNFKETKAVLVKFGKHKLYKMVLKSSQTSYILIKQNNSFTQVLTLSPSK